MNEILEAKNLVYCYEKDHPVLKDVSFSIHAGEYVCLIGHNGSGKSTLAKIIMGLLPNFEGGLRLFSMDLSQDNLYKIRAKEGIVFQNPDNQFVGSTVEDDIAFGLENKNIKPSLMKEMVEKAAAEVGMSAFLTHEPENLSGGQKQRVAIAGVLAMKPDLIIFDEATAMLDPKGKKEVNAVIQKLREEKPEVALLSITHDVEEAYASDRVLILSDGVLVADGDPKVLLEDKEILKKGKLRTPFLVQMKEALEKHGVPVPSTVDDLQSLEDYLW